MKDIMNIVIASSKEYCKYAPVMLLSLCRHNRGKLRIFFYYNEEMSEELKKLGEMVTEYDNEFIPMYVSKEKTDTLADCDTWHPSTWYRWMCIEDLKGKYDRALMLGVDMIVTGDISEYYYQDFDGKYLVMIQDSTNMYEWYVIFDECAEKGKKKEDYVNAESCLMDITHLSDVMTLDKMMKCYAEDKVLCMDQGIINYYFSDYIKVIKDHKFNFGVNAAYETLNSDEYMGRLKKSIIWHYAGDKPWTRYNESCAHKEWMKYAAEVGISESVKDDIILSMRKMLLRENRNCMQYKNNYTLLNKLWECVNKGEALEKTLVEHNFKKIAIYGAGVLCKHLVEYLSKTDVSVEYILDSNVEGVIYDTECFKIDNAKNLKMVDAIIVTPVLYFDEIKERISQRTTCNTLSIEDVLKWNQQ